VTINEVLPLLLRAQRWERWPLVQRVLSLGVAALGVMWLVERVAGG
jgi:hypothetical protein